MKHLYKLLFIFCFISASKAQVNSYFNNNPVWMVRSFYMYAQSCATVTTYNYYLNGDTVIGAFQYKKVYKKGYGNLQSWPTGPTPGPGNPCLAPPPPIYFGPTLEFFIRSAGKKMYVYNPPGYSGDTLLYDFNLNVGDTLPLTYNNMGFPNSSFVVTSMDSINTLNGWMKRFYLNGSSYLLLMEGTGFIRGLIETMPTLLCGCGSDLLCYSQNTTTYYSLISAPSCFITTGVNENAFMKKLVIYPNPSSGKYSIFSDESYLDAKLEVYNVQGQLILSLTSQNQSTEIDLKEHPDGIYFLRCAQDNSNSYFKLIKQ